MTAQGWTPGQYLGAKDAAHAEFHTAANASYIRVAVRGDNLGLGAKIGSGVGPGECTGLDVFQNLLGRLNGRDEEDLAKEQKSREDLKRAIYTERKWGNVRFVRGGFLVGDKIQELVDGAAKTLLKPAEVCQESGSGEADEAPVPVMVEGKNCEKQKLHMAEETSPKVTVKVKKSKKKRKLEATSDDTQEISGTVLTTKDSKKNSKKERKDGADTEDTTEDMKANKIKKTKKDKKEKNKSRGSSVAEDSTTNESKKSKQEKHKSGTKDTSRSSKSTSSTTTKESTPAGPVSVESSGRSTPMMQGRHAVRSRNIAAKRLAGMDLASLNQVSHVTINVITSNSQLTFFCRFL